MLDTINDIIYIYIMCVLNGMRVLQHKSEQNMGVAKNIMELEQRVLYTHCYSHALNLEAQDARPNAITKHHQM